MTSKIIDQMKCFKVRNTFNEIVDVETKKEQLINNIQFSKNIYIFCNTFNEIVDVAVVSSIIEDGVPHLGARVTLKMSIKLIRLMWLFLLRKRDTIFILYMNRWTAIYSA